MSPELSELLRATAELRTYASLTSVAFGLFLGAIWILLELGD